MAYKPKVLAVADGGTGDASLTAYAPLAGGNSTTGALQNTSQLIYCTFGSSALSSLAAGGASSVNINSVNLLCFNDGVVFEQFNQTSVSQAAPTLSGGAPGSGVTLSSVVGAASKGIELTNGKDAAAKTNRTINTSPAFFLQATFSITTDNLVSNLFIGFRKKAGYTATLATYSDFATIGIVGTNSPAKIQIQTQVGSGGVTTTDTTNTWASAASHTLKVLVSSGGVVTYTIDGSAPSTTAAFTFNSGGNVIPFMWYTTPAGGSAEVDITSWIFGNQ